MTCNPQRALELLRLGSVETLDGLALQKEPTDA